MTIALAPLAKRAATPRRQGFSQTGFTLLEILLVTAILSILAAILLQTLATARYRSRDLICRTNLRSIALGWKQYLVDSRGQFLKAVRAKDNSNINYGGKQGSSSAYRGPKPLNPYLGLPLVVGPEQKAEVFRCPFDIGAGWIRPTCHDRYGSSYLMNHILVGQPKLQIDANDPCEAVLSRVSDAMARIDEDRLFGPGRVLLAADYGWYNAWSSSCTPELHIDWHRPPLHYNAALADGHVDLVRIRKGWYTTSQYTLIPFEEEQAAIGACQGDDP